MKNINLNLFWKKNPNDRLQLWSELRKTHNVVNIQETTQMIWNLWVMSPCVNINIDPYDFSTWPTLWEMIHEGTCCKFSRALGAAYCLYYMNCSADIKIARVYDKRKNDIYTAAIIDNSIIMTEYTIDLESIDKVSEYITIEEIWKIEEIMDKVLYKVN